MKMVYNYGTHKGRYYRFSSDRHMSGTPISIQRRCVNGKTGERSWRNVRNVDTIWEIRNLAETMAMMGTLA